MLLLSLLALVLLCSLVPAVLFCINLRLYREPPMATADHPQVAVLIPARNEEANIVACVRSVLGNGCAIAEVLVMDDGSSDGTAERVRALAAENGCVRLLSSAPLPGGWNGKQYACWQLAQATPASLLLFLDADVRLAPDAVPRMAAFQQRSGASLVSGFPRQITVTFLEWLLLPLIHFVLLGFLPMSRMRKSTRPAYAAACGQFLMVDRSAYFDCGGHAAIRETMHDGLRLPKLLRRHGYRTDLADLTNLAEVRMYHSAAGVWNGLAKNATEGLGAPGRIVPLTCLLLLGQVVPALAVVGLALAAAWILSYAHRHDLHAGFAWPTAVLWLLLTLAAAFLCSYLPRVLVTRRFRQPLKSALLHPAGIVVLLALQWYALVRQWRGMPVGWRARSYTGGSGAEVQR